MDRSTFTSTLGSGLAVALLGVCAAGCNGDSDNDGPLGVGNLAVQVTLSPLESNLRSGATNLSGAITVGTVANPNAELPGSTTTVALGGAANDGTATVDVTVDDQRASDGSGTLTVRVEDAGNGFDYLLVTMNYGAPSISFRAPPLAYAGLSSAGVGRAFIVARITQTATITRAFTNSSGAATLVDFTGVSPALTTANDVATLTTIRDLHFTYQISLNGADLEADIVDVTESFWATRRLRQGGPTVNQIGHGFVSLVVGSRGFDPDYDVSIPVGVDADAGNPISDGSAFGLQVDIFGGVAGEPFLTDVSGAITSSLTGSTLSTVSLSGNLSSLVDVNDGVIQVDGVNAVIDIDSISYEDLPSSGVFAHSLGSALGTFRNLEDLLYLRAETEIDRRLLLFH